MFPWSMDVGTWVCIELTYTVEFEPRAVVRGMAVSFTPILGFIGSKAFAASTHSVTSGITAEKMLASRFTSLKGGGRIGILRPNPASMEMDTFASTRARGPSTIISPVLGVVVLPDSRPGSVLLLLPPQFAAALVESLASRRGRSIDKVISAVSLLRNSNPIGMVGLNARPSRMSMSMTSTLKGSDVSVDPWKPVIPLLPMLVSSRRAMELSGI
jgi:hypothetical protein